MVIVWAALLVAAFGLCSGKGSHSTTEILTARFSVGNITDSVDFRVDQNKLTNNQDWVTVSWSGMSHPDDKDWVALYSPASADITQTAPIKLKYAFHSPTHLSSGSGSLQFSIINMRADFAFVFFRGGMSSPVAVAKSKTITFRNFNEPSAARISFTDTTPHSVRISWSSLDTDSPMVRYRIGLKQFTSNATTTTYRQDEMCGPPASGYGWREPGRIHHAVLDGLEPSMPFQYQFGSVKTGWSRTYTGKVPPAPGADSVSFFAFGDVGTASADGALSPFWTQPASRKTTEYLIDNLELADFLLHIGDISYAVGFQSSWDSFLDQIAPISMALPYQTAIGNHERDYEGSNGLFDVDDSGGECGLPYRRRFPTPDGSLEKTWYSLESGPVHTLVMSTEHDFSKGSEQYDFIANDLMNVDRVKTPWLIVAGHRPMYVDTSADIYGDASEKVVSNLMRTQLEDLFITAQVDIALWGHDHSYQRSCPVFNNKCTIKGDDDGYSGPIHLVVGAAGMELSPNASKPGPAWLSKRIDQYGTGFISATRSKLDFQFIEYLSNNVVDSFSLRKPSPSRKQSEDILIFDDFSPTEVMVL
uniref:Purple acid phosphatase n=1 Tax=Spongospora subterranea TaxID=70186 RepID=A0A0H5RPH5_9EUKA|eukprot:CRZ10624.1 hypothetical protein [Spongospora subterranea]